MQDYRTCWSEQHETCSLNEFRKIQTDALLGELRHVWEKSEFYQEKFSNAGVELGDIKRAGGSVQASFHREERIAGKLGRASSSWKARGN